MSVRKARLAALAAFAMLGLAAQPAPAVVPLGDQFRVSQMGADGDEDTDGRDAALAYNSQANQFLIVWSGEDTETPQLETEVFGRLFTAGGSPLGDEFRISDMGPDGVMLYGGFAPAVAYNPQANEYLVAWHGDDDIAPLIDEEIEIFAQRLSATGTEEGANDFRVSDMGPDMNTSHAAFSPAIAYNPAANQYLVAWSGNDGDDQDIYAQRLSASGLEEGTNDFRVSDMGPDGNTNFGTADAAVAFNPQASEYLVAWSGDDSAAPLVDNENEIFAQRLTATGTEDGDNDFRVSDMGPDEDTNFSAARPALAYNPQANEYLVAWQGDDDIPPVANEREIFAQRLSATGTQEGANDFRISDVGPDGETFPDAEAPRVAYGAQGNEYLVAWEADDAADEDEIYAQLLSANGAELDTNDFRISEMGPDGDSRFGGGSVAIAYGAQANEYLVAWDADDDTPPLIDDETEVFARRIGLAPPGPGPGAGPGPGPGPAGRLTPEFDSTVTARLRRGRYRVVVRGSLELPAAIPRADAGAHQAQAAQCSGTLAIAVRGPRNRRIIRRRTQVRPSCGYRRVLRFRRARVRKRIGRRQERRLERFTIVTRFGGNASLTPVRDRFGVRIRR